MSVTLAQDADAAQLAKLQLHHDWRAKLKPVP
jgi:hypothetical protein